MASRHRAQLPVLACVAAALACAHVASCFSRGDLVLCTWGGDSFSTGSLQLVVPICLRSHVILWHARTDLMPICTPVRSSSALQLGW